MCWHLGSNASKASRSTQWRKCLEAQRAELHECWVDFVWRKHTTATLLHSKALNVVSAWNQALPVCLHSWHIFVTQSCRPIQVQHSACDDLSAELRERALEAFRKAGRVTSRYLKSESERFNAACATWTGYEDIWSDSAWSWYSGHAACRFEKEHLFLWLAAGSHNFMVIENQCVSYHV